MPRKPLICTSLLESFACVCPWEEGLGRRKTGHNQMAISWWECPTNGHLNMKCVCFNRYQDHMMGLFCPWSLAGRWLKWSKICLECSRRGFNPQVRKIPLEKGMTTCSSFLAWRITRTEEPGRLQSIVLQRDTTEQKNNRLIMRTKKTGFQIGQEYLL